VSIKVNITNSSFIFNDLINDLIVDYPMLSNTAISYWEEELQTYVYCGIIPVNYQITLPINIDYPIVIYYININ